MAENFKGKWRFTVSQKNAGFSQRIVISGASSGNGAHDGVVGNTFWVDGENWTAHLEWNNDSGSGWQPSGMVVGTGSKSPLQIVKILYGDDNFPADRDGDYDDIVVHCEDFNPAFEVTQRPYSVDRGTLMMMPDGIFETSQGIQYMGVKIKNEWHFDWEEYMGFMIGISPDSKIALASQGIIVLDSWSTTEEYAFQQKMDNGFVRIPRLAIGAETTVYFKVDVSAANPSKPEVGFVAQRIAWDPIYSHPDLTIDRQIFISRSTYDPVNHEMIAEVPEGTVYMRLNRTMVDKFNAEKAVKHARKYPCPGKPPKPGSNGTPGGGGNGGGKLNKDQLRKELKNLLEALLECKDIDPCELTELLHRCCDCDGDDGRGDGSKPGGTWTGPWGNPDNGGMGDGSGGDNWCRFKPFAWLPYEFEYRVVPNPAYAGKYGPLAFEDPWWKVLLILIAVILAIASIITDMATAGSDPQFIIGQITNKSNRAVSNVDAALSSLDGSRGVNLTVLDAQGDDENNNLPINALDGTIAFDRTNNGDSGIEDAAIGDIVFKSGARSATTRGTVISVNMSANVEDDDGTIFPFTNQVQVGQLPAPDNQPLSQAGDSGSLWVKLSTFRPVALNFAGPQDDLGGTGTANPIRDVVNLFGIRFNN